MADVSVLTPSFNYGRFIEDALLSVLGQEGGVSVQHVIQDAESSDETLDVLSRYNGEVEWRSQSDRGQSDALNKALSRATGRWIAWLNADEFYLPGTLSHLIEVGERSRADVVYGECAHVDEGGRLARLLPQHRFNARVLKEYGCYISSSSTIFRRSALGEGPWDETVWRMMDWDLYMRLARDGARFEFAPYPAAAFRVHDQQVTAAPRERFYEENAMVTPRYGRPADPVERWKASRVGRWMHPAYKLMDGAYLRQWRARSLHGRDLRWFREEVGDGSVNSLMSRCYAQ